jgi:L-iditol 2-dehydrogenase
MLSAVLVEPRRIEVIERTLPDLGPTDVRVRVDACGVCASDVDFWQGTTQRSMPEPLGHEPAGVVIDVGRDVATIKPGDRVACWVEGGGFSEEFIADEQHCIQVAPDCRHPEIAEPLGCIVNAVELAAPQIADDIVIIGAGFMGNLLQLISALRGPRTVTVADQRPAALARAKSLGATSVIDTSHESLAEQIARSTVRGADVVYEVTGVQAGLDLAESATRMSGKLCIVGYHQGASRQIQLGTWNWMAFTIVNAHFRDRNVILSGMQKGLRLLENGVIDVTPLMTDTFPLTGIDAAFEAAASKPKDFVKAIIRPN